MVKECGNKMKTKFLGICIGMLLIAATVLPVAGTMNEESKDTTDNPGRNLLDCMMPSGNERTPVEIDNINLISSDRLLSCIPPEYEFITEPMTIMTSWYDYMPGSYASHPIRHQTENGDGYYVTFHGTESATAERLQYWTYIDADGAIVDSGTVTSDDRNQGYGGIGIHPATGNPIVSWHEDFDTDDKYETPLTFDDFDFAETPGDWQIPYVIESPVDMEYIWPYVYVGPSPLGSSYVRVYQLANNYQNLPSGDPCEDVRIMYTDVENVNGADLSGLLESVNWDTVTVFTDWRDKSIRPFQSFAIDYINPGKVGFIGSAAWLEGDQGNMPVEEGAFVWESLDYGETWSYDHLYSDGPTDYIYKVENPGFSGAPSQLEVSINGFHNTGLYDSNGCLHGTFMQSYGYSDSGGSYFFPYFLPQAEMVWDGDSFTFHEVPELQGIDPLSGHSVPWTDIDHVYPTITWNTYSSDTFHENTQKQAINLDNGWMVQMWCDGTYAQLGLDGEPGYEEYVQHPLIYISTSVDNGNSWSDPIMLTDVNSDVFDFSEQITVYPYICDQIIDLGDDWGQIDMYYMDDNNFGSNVHGGGAKTGGQITYCSLKIKFDEPISDPKLEITDVTGGFGKVNVEIENVGEVNASDVDWSISVNGGLLGLINVSTDGSIVTFTVGDTETVQTEKFIFGLGTVNITIDVKYAETWTGTAFVFGPFVLGIKEE